MDIRWRDAPGRAAEVLGTEGFKSLFFRALGQTVYRRLLLIERDLAAPEAGEFCRLPDVEARQVGPEDIDAHRAFLPDVSRDSLERRLEGGDIGVAVWHAGRIVNVGWAALGRCHIGYVRLYADLSPGVAYLYDIFTAPEYRGLRLTAARWATMERLLRERGVRIEIGAVSPENTPVLRSSERAGFRAVGRVGWWGVGPWRRPFLRYEGDAPPVRLVGTS